MYRLVLEHREQPSGRCLSVASLIEGFLLLQLGEESQVLDCLEQGYDEGWLQPAMYFQTSPIWDPLRDEPRFRALMDKMNLAPWSGLREAGPPAVPSDG